MDDCRVSVTIVGAIGLAAKHSKGHSSDPYALVRIGHLERRTKTVKRSLKPTWNECFEFESKLSNLLRIALYDADQLTHDHFLGEVILPVATMSDDSRPIWHELEVRPGSHEFVSGQLCCCVQRSGPAPSKDAPVANPKGPKLKRTESAVERQSFGSTPFSRPFVIDPAELTFSPGAPLGQGGFGEVRAGFFRGLPVAVKTLLVRDGVKNEELMEEFFSEVAMLAKVSHHPKLCLFLGASLTQPLTVVSELMAGGSVRNILDKPREESVALLSWTRRVEMLLDAALGMAFLHGMPVLHRDLKCDNLLLDDHASTKIADFGLSKTVAFAGHEHGDVGTPGFKAPEMYDESSKSIGYSLPADVFAFGATIYELLSFTEPNWGWPYGWALDLATDEEVETAVRRGDPPTALGGGPIQTDCPAPLRSLYESCVAFDPTKRPSFNAMVPILRGLLATLREGSSQTSAAAASSSSSKASPSKAAAVGFSKSARRSVPLPAIPAKGTSAYYDAGAELSREASSSSSEAAANKSHPSNRRKADTGKQRLAVAGPEKSHKKEEASATTQLAQQDGLATSSARGRRAKMNSGGQWFCTRCTQHNPASADRCTNTESCNLLRSVVGVDL